MWNKVCDIEALTPYSGVGALIGRQTVAIFYLPETESKVFAIDNWDPIGKAFVLSRGIVGDIDGKPVVASPLYKQHFILENGECIEEPDKSIKSWPIEVRDNHIWIES